MAIKNQQEILQKLRIEQLNPMQEEAHQVFLTHPEMVLLSPTGTGKTLAFLLPIVEQLEESCKEIQVLILVPSRELAIQIEQVAREMGTGFKINTVYGGRHVSNDKINLAHKPAILIGTPGRVADHIRRETFSLADIKTLVLDEFDKSLEIGFEKEMEEILFALEALERKILTSATSGISIPRFVGLNSPKQLNFLDQKKSSRLQIRRILSPTKDKLGSLVQALAHLGDQPGIVFCNFKDSIRRVSEALDKSGIRHGCFYGGMEQRERERALIKFRNGTHQLLIATDLAARGIDVPEIKFIIHYHLPVKSEEFTHRNGRTARMNASGTAFVLIWDREELPPFIDAPQTERLTDSPLPKPSPWATLYITGGRRDKISKGDIAGLLFKKGDLQKGEVGIIEVKQDEAFVAVAASKVEEVIPLINNSRLKKKKVRIGLA